MADVRRIDQSNGVAAGAPLAFLSYAHVDDDFLGGAIGAPCSQVTTGVRAFSGLRDFEIFLDRDGIEFREDFLPMLTPSYSESDFCRRELRKSLGSEDAAGRNDLLLPAYLRGPRVLLPRDRASSVP